MKKISPPNIKKIKEEDGKWFIFILEDDYNGGARNELTDSLSAFSADIGHMNWVVQGHYNEKREFLTAVISEYKLYLIGHYDRQRFPTPALLITNGTAHESNVNDLIRIVVPLQDFYAKPGDTANFLKNLAVTLQEPDAAEQLRRLNKRRLETVWGWIRAYSPKGIAALGVAADVIGVLGFAAGG